MKRSIRVYGSDIDDNNTNVSIFNIIIEGLNDIIFSNFFESKESFESKYKRQDIIGIRVLYRLSMTCKRMHGLIGRYLHAFKTITCTLHETPQYSTKIQMCMRDEKICYGNLTYKNDCKCGEHETTGICFNELVECNICKRLEHPEEMEELCEDSNCIYGLCKFCKNDDGLLYTVTYGYNNREHWACQYHYISYDTYSDDNEEPSEDSCSTSSNTD